MPAGLIHQAHCRPRAQRYIPRFTLVKAMLHSPYEDAGSRQAYFHFMKASPEYHSRNDAGQRDPIPLPAESKALRADEHIFVFPVFYAGEDSEGIDAVGRNPVIVAEEACYILTVSPGIE